MNHTLAGIRSRVIIDKLDDEDFDPNIVDNFINDAQRDIFSSYTLPFTEKIFTGSLPEGETMFQFPSDVSSLQSFIINDGQGRNTDILNNFMSFSEFNRQYPYPVGNAVGSIGNWSIYGNKMLVSRPIPAGYTMTLYYNKVPATLAADTDVPEIPEEFQEALVLGAYYRVQLREGDSEEALLTKSEYQRKLEQMVERYGFRMNAGPIKLKNRQVGR